MEEGIFPDMGLKKRILFFLICIAVGILCGILSILILMGIIPGGLTFYAIISSIGNIATLLSSGFLIGFKS